MALSRSRRGERGIDYWPGFVDALSTFLLAIIFMLSVFMLAQFFLSREIAGKDETMLRLQRQIAELGDLLQLERGQRQTLQEGLAAITATLGTSDAERRRLQGCSTRPRARPAMPPGAPPRSSSSSPSSGATPRPPSPRSSS